MRRPAEEGPDADLDLLADDPEGTGGGDQDDPLAAYEEETRTAIEARAQELAAQRRQELDTEFQEHKANHSRRMTNARKALQEQFGLDIDDEGKPVYRDPTKLTQAAIQMGGRQPAEGNEPDPLDEPIDAFNDSPEIIEAKINRRAERIADQRMAKIEERLARAEGAAYRPLNQAVPDLAREVLEARGHGDITEHPDFAETVTNMARSMSGGNPDLLNDPQLVKMAALASIALLEDSLPDDVRARSAEARRGQDPAALAAEARRRASGQTGVSRHTPARGQAFTDDDIAESEELRSAYPESAGRMTPAMAREMRKIDGDGMNIDDWRNAQRRPAGARR